MQYIMNFLSLLFVLLKLIHEGLSQCPYSFMDRGMDTVCYGVNNLMTTSNGAPIDDEVGWISPGPRGPLLLQDFVFMDDYAHFDREKVPERVVHANGAGALGHFEVTNCSFTNYCKASLFQEVGKKTELVVRFSIGPGGTGCCDTVRAARGLAIKFYTDDGNYDLLTINFPIFFAEDPMWVPSFLHATPDPVNMLPSPDHVWDLFSLRQESVHNLMMAFTDRGLTADYRHTDYFAVNVYKTVNHCGQPFYVKFIFKSDLGVVTINDTYAATICASDFDHARRDLYNNIAAGEYPCWTLYYQVMTFEEAEKFKWNPFDVTKVWPHAEHPIHEIGKLVLTSNTPNHFAYVEQAAYTPSHMVPGIEASPDKILQARLFTYPDAHRYRIGKNYQQLPVNAPKVPMLNLHRDGFMIIDNQNGKPNYYPNDELNTCPKAAWSKWSVCGDVARYDVDKDTIYEQPATFWNKVLTEEKKTILVELLCASLGTVQDKTIQDRAVGMFNNVSECLGSRLKECLASS